MRTCAAVLLLRRREGDEWQLARVRERGDRKSQGDGESGFVAVWLCEKKDKKKRERGSEELKSLGFFAV